MTFLLPSSSLLLKHPNDDDDSDDDDDDNDHGDEDYFEKNAGKSIITRTIWKSSNYVKITFLRIRLPITMMIMIEATMRLS